MIQYDNHHILSTCLASKKNLHGWDVPRLAASVSFQHLGTAPGAEDLLKAVASLHSSNIFHLALSPESVRLRPSALKRGPSNFGNVGWFIYAYRISMKQAMVGAFGIHRFYMSVFLVVYRSLV